MKTLDQLSTIIYNDNRIKGFECPSKNTTEKILLVISELCEAVEAMRINKYSLTEQYKKQLHLDINVTKFKTDIFELYIKDSFEDEIADTIIRILDICKAMDIDIYFHIMEKILYNKTRPFKHDKIF